MGASLALRGPFNPVKKTRFCGGMPQGNAEIPALRREFFVKGTFSFDARIQKLDRCLFGENEGSSGSCNLPLVPISVCLVDVFFDQGLHRVRG